MASNREERFLMRQRGAGVRQLRSSGFDFTIPGISKSPLKPVASGRSRRTPRLGLQPQRSSTRTPKVTPLILQKSSRRTPATRSSQTSVEAINTNVGSESSHEATIGSLASSRRKRRLETLIEDVKSLAQVNEDNPVVEEPVNHSFAERTSKKRKKRKSIGQNSRKRVKSRPSIAGVTEPLVSPPSISTRSTSERKEPGSTDFQPVTQGSAVREVKSRRKKRKSIGKLLKPKRKSLAVSSLSTQNLQTTSTENPSSSQLEDWSLQGGRNPGKQQAPVEEESEDGLLGLSPNSSIPRTEREHEYGGSSSTQPRRRGRPRKSNLPKNVAEHIRVPKASSERIAAPQKKAQKRQSTDDRTERPVSKPRPGAIPIIVHRISGRKALEHVSAEEDILSNQNPFPKKSSVNAIDVLSQICREMLTKTIESFKLNGTKERGELQRAESRKRKAVEMFRDELDARLFQMTEALDNNYALAVRLRQASKEKAKLREELLEIKRQREEIAIESDGVRALHEHRSKIAEDENDLNTMIEDIELAVQRGRAFEQAGGDNDDDNDDEPGELELKLRTVAEKVSSAGGGGILDKVKAFNKMMERAIAVL